MRLVASIIYCLVISAQAVVAGEIIDASVTKSDGVYNASVDALINAPLHLVYESISDYANLSAINPSIVESQILRVLGPDRYRVRSVIEVCILIYCKRVEQVQDMTHKDARTIEAVTLPEYSDFRDGVARWRFTEVGPSTEMYFTHRFEPDFWVPPVIGTWLIKRTLVHEVNQTAIAIERMARKEWAK